MVRSPRQASPNPDIYDPDDVGLRNSPLKEMHIKLQPSPSPPPLIGPNRLSPISTPSSVTRRKGPKQKSKPCLGDASIINSMDGGKHPDLARKAGNEPLASDDEDTDHSMRGTEVEIKAAAVKREPNGIDLTALAADALRAHEGRASQEPLQQAEDRDDDVMMDGSTTPNGTTIIRPRSREAERALQPRSISYVDVQSTNTPDSSIKSEPHPTSAGELPPLQRQSSIPGMPVGNGARPIRLPSISSQLGALSHIDPAVTGEQSSNAQTPPASLQRPRYAPPTSQPSTPRSPSAAACPLPSPGQASNQFYYDQGPHRTMSQATAYQYPSMVDYNSSNTDGVVLRQGSVPPSSAPPINRMSIDGITNPQVGAFKCNFPGCKSSFSTQYLLNSHANVHSSNRPHYCSVQGCSRAEGGKGFKRKNEMIRHGLVHISPGYICPFCPDREHKYPRPDNLQRHVRVHHTDRDKDDPRLREVLSQRPEGPSKGRRRRGGPT